MGRTCSNLNTHSLTEFDHATNITAPAVAVLPKVGPGPIGYAGMHARIP